MKKIIILLTAFAAALVFSGCNMMAGSGVLVETEFYTDGFTAVEAGYTCDLTIIRGEDYSITVTCDDNLAQYLVVEENNGILKIDLQPYNVYNHISFKAAVVMPEIESVTGSGASKISVSGFTADGTFSAELTGASKGFLSFISVEDVKAVVSGASDLTFSTETMTGNLAVDCSGASKADMKACEADVVKAVVSGASSAWINTDGNLSGSVTGASYLYYQGSPDFGNLDVDISSDVGKY